MQPARREQHKEERGGGKGTWGKLGDEYKGTHVMDKGDPNYDDEAEAAVFEASSRSHPVGTWPRPSVEPKKG